MSFTSERDAAAEKYTDVELCGKSIDEQHVFDAFNKGHDHCLTQSSVVRELVFAVRYEVRKYGDASPELESVLKAYDLAVREVRGE